jgi:hypothetical protein
VGEDYYAGRENVTMKKSLLVLSVAPARFNNS